MLNIIFKAKWFLIEILSRNSKIFSFLIVIATYLDKVNDVNAMLEAVLRILPTSLTRMSFVN